MATKKPQDHKPKAEKAVEPHDVGDLFEYTTRDGKHTIQLPFLENLTRKQIRALRDAESSGKDADDVLFELLLDEDGLEALDEFTLWDQKNLMDEWNAESAISLGE